MDFLRTLVSQQKNRYEEGGFNLDLTYITPRTVAMAFPAGGFESLFRNPIEEVARLLDSKHADRYIVFNASNRAYDESKFFNRVRSMNWPNHYPCPLEHFITMVLESLEFLLADPLNVVIVHCLAGKGRTGSFLNALHYATGQFASIHDANGYYLRKRAVNVTYPSQLRYLDYFVDFCRHGADDFDFANKSVDRVQLVSTNKEFIVNLNHVIRFFDFSRQEFQLAEGLFPGNMRKEENPESPEQPLYVSECQLSPWKDSNSVDILINLRTNTLLSAKALRANFSMLGVKGDRVVFSLKDVDKPKAVPQDLRLVLFLNRFAVGKEAQGRQETLQKLHLRYLAARTKVETAGLRQTLFGEEALKEPANENK